MESRLVFSGDFKSLFEAVEFFLILALPGGDFNGAGTFFFPTIETPDGLIFGCLLSSDESELLSSLTDWSLDELESESDESDESNSFAFCRTSSFVCSAAVLGGLPRPRFCFFAAGVGADAASASRAFFLSASLAYQTEIIKRTMEICYLC